jgi:prepilin-type N-terminal cleavage/methylation domain-containing protein
MKKQSFTLIEMLVVIGIIGILAAMVMPALGSARAAGQKTDCINNKKQLITAMIAYSTDNDSAMIYCGSKGNDSRTYAAILNGLDGRGREYLAKKLFMCAAAKGELNNDASGDVSGTNAAGMLNAINAGVLGTLPANTNGGWLNTSSKKVKDGSNFKTFYQIHGRFATLTNNTIVYYTDRMKAGGSNLLLFADTFRRGDEAEAYWNFTPGGASNTNYYVTLMHNGMTVGAFADGHADALDAGKLKDSGDEVTCFNNSDFEKDKLSD